MAALTPQQVQTEVTAVDGQTLLLFHTGWSPFSNFHTSPFVIDKQRYATVEQFYQVQKAKHFGDAQAVIEILKTRSPRRCKDLGRRIQNFDAVEWSRIAPEFMLQGVKEKFLQSSALRKQLLETKGKILAEATEFDTYWATGLNIEDPANGDMENWPGRNMLGKIIMQVRDMIPV